MDNKALYKLSYGLFVLATRSGEKTNACITNTCMQVANSPTRVAISCINANYTCALIKESGIFTLSLLEQGATFDTIRHFGFQSGRTVDKLQDLYMPEDLNGVPYLPWHTCAHISCKVISATDLGSHTLFIAEVVDAQVHNDNPPMTYAYYQDSVKPKPQPQQKGWRCKICGHVYEGDTLPADYVCPLCKHGAADFEPIA